VHTAKGLKQFFIHTNSSNGTSASKEQDNNMHIHKMNSLLIEIKGKRRDGGKIKVMEVKGRG
jgi:hypothetical protein